VTPADREALDRATILRLYATSSPEALRRAADAEAAGHPAYDAPGTLRWTQRVCGFSPCWTPFVVRRTVAGQRYCSPGCYAAEMQERFLARTRGTRRAARRAAALAAVARRREAVA